jgi:hypothetical protein
VPRAKPAASRCERASVPTPFLSTWFSPSLLSLAPSSIALSALSCGKLAGRVKCWETVHTHKRQETQKGMHFQNLLRERRLGNVRYAGRRNAVNIMVCQVGVVVGRSWCLGMPPLIPLSFVHPLPFVVVISVLHLWCLLRVLRFILLWFLLLWLLLLPANAGLLLFAGKPATCKTAGASLTYADDTSGQTPVKSSPPSNWYIRGVFNTWRAGLTSPSPATPSSRFRQGRWQSNIHS